MLSWRASHDDHFNRLSSSMQSSQHPHCVLLFAGVAYIEVQKGAYISAAVPFLVADKALAASEAPQLLQAAADEQSHAGLITDFALVSSALSRQRTSRDSPSEMEDEQPGRPISGDCSKSHEPPPALASMMACVPETAVCTTARKLLEAACRRGASRLIQYLLPVAADYAAGRQQQPNAASADAHPSLLASHASQQIIAAPDAGGMTLLHRTVQSGSSLALDALLDGSRQLGIHWQVRPCPLLLLPPDLLQGSR